MCIRDSPIVAYKGTSGSAQFRWVKFNSDGIAQDGDYLWASNSQYVSMVTDHSGIQQVALKADDGVRFKSQVDAPASTSVVVTNSNSPGGFISLDIDSYSNPHMIYRLEVGSKLAYSYSADSGSTWNHQIIDAEGNIPFYYTSVKIDSKDVPHVVYSSYDEIGFRYAFKNTSGWQITKLDGVNDGLDIDGYGHWVSMDLDSNDSPHISFHDTGSKSLKYAVLNKADSDDDGCLDTEDAFPNDAYEQFDDDGNGVGDNEDYSGRIYNISPVNGSSTGGTEVTITGSNFDSLISQDTQEQNWKISTVDSNAITGGGLSIAIDKPENKIYAIYRHHDSESLVLKMDQKYEGSWSNVWQRNSGSWPSLAVNQETNNVMISYSNQQSQSCLLYTSPSPRD